VKVLTCNSKAGVEKSGNVVEAHSYQNFVAYSATLSKNSCSETRESSTQLISDFERNRRFCHDLGNGFPFPKVRVVGSPLKCARVRAQLQPQSLGQVQYRVDSDCKHVNKSNLYNHIHGIQINPR